MIPEKIRILFLSTVLFAFPSMGTVITDFTEATLDSNIQLDVPNPVGNVTFDAGADELRLTTTANTDMWTARNNAPIAWTSRPVVGAGESWYAETFIRYNGAANGGQRVAGITLYPGPDGTGGSTQGMDFSLGLNDWNDRGVELQGWGSTDIGDSTLTFISATANNESSAHLRLQVTENGATDAFVAYWKANDVDPWIQFASFNSGVDSSRVGLFLKTGPILTYPTDASVSFDYFNVAAIPEPSAFGLFGLGGLALIGAARRHRRSK
ncbi:MAG: hypothetical protein ACI9TH_000675 [Kiritimatiellia bacterium]|jgi:hypothetical protein